MANRTDHDIRRIRALLREGRSDRKIAKALGLHVDEVRAAIDRMIDAAGLSDDHTVERLAERAGLVTADED
jgi:DNA-binding NarL/FixJ family response regulator